VPAHFNFTRDVVDTLAADPARAALTFVDREGIVDRRTFHEISGDAARWAHLLRTRLDRGDRVLFAIGKVPAWHCAMLGALKSGLVSVPSPDMLRARDLAFRTRHSGARLVVADRSLEPEIEEMRHQVGANVSILYLDEALEELRRYMPVAPTEDTVAGETAFILYTSGTTKDPKGVVHTHAYTWAQRAQATHWLDAHEGDVVWCTAGTGWAKAIWNSLLGPWSHGAEIVLHQGPFDAEERLSLLQRLGVTVLCQAPTEYRMLAKLESLGAAHLPRLRHAVSAGEPLNPEVIARFQDALGLTVHDGYGQTENSLLVANPPGAPVRPGSMGVPTPGHDVAVIDESGHVCPPGVEGDLAVIGRPPTLFVGYWDAPEETEAVFRDGWYLTGDRATRDEDGYLWFVGRSDDVILSAAYRIGPFEVESALLEHPAVAESGVVGVPDLDRGQIVKAFVVLRPGHEPGDRLARELQEHVKAVTAPYKYPRAITFVDELPKTPSGKIRRSELRRLNDALGVSSPRMSVVPDAPEVDTVAVEAAAAEEAARLAAEAEAAAERERAEAVERARREAAAAAERARAEAEERARREAEETARAEAEAAEGARADAEAAERARTEAEAAERARAEEEAADKARAEAEAAERARREAEEAEARHRAEEEERARAEAEAAERARADAEAAERARVEAEAAERARADAEAAELARAEAEAAEKARAEAEAAERARLEAEEAEARHRAEEEERARADAEAAERARADAEAAELARAEAEAAEKARAEAEAAERARAEAEAEAEAWARIEAAEEAARRRAEEEEEEEEAAALAALAEAPEAPEELEEDVDEVVELDEEELGSAATADPNESRADARRRRRAEKAEAKRLAEEQRRLAKEAEEQRKRDEVAAREEAKRRAEEEKLAAKQRAEDEKRRAEEEKEAAKRRAEEERVQAKLDAEQAKRQEAAAREAEKAAAKQAAEDERRRQAAEREQARLAEEEERRRQRAAAKAQRGGGLGRLFKREEHDEFEDDDETPAAPIPDIVERLRVYSRDAADAPASEEPEVGTAGVDETVGDDSPPATRTAEGD
jgi:acetyl-CoA synthetase/medium-chain acyl-CoA synthetase